MSLSGQTVRIIVHEPLDWDKGNLFGTIIMDRGGKRIVLKLLNEIVGQIITNDIIELKPFSDKETFKPLGQYYSVMVNGNLISENGDTTEHLLYGSVTID